MKFSIFSDFHYNPIDFDPDPAAKLERLREIQRRAEREDVAFIIHAGDFCHDAPKRPELMDLYNNFHIPSYHCLGNHDTDRAPLDEVLKCYNMEDCQYYFDCEGYRFIIFDPNYSNIDGKFVHCELTNYFTTFEQREWLPPENIEWMRKTIEESPYPCVLIGHSSLERSDGLRNRLEVRKMIREQNEKRPHSVLMAISGHYHRDFIRILDNVCYFDINSASFDWIPNPHSFYPKELCAKTGQLENLLIYNDPIHAIITLEGTTIKIDGMESSFFMGVRREDTDNTVLDNGGRECTPRVQSAKFTLL